MGVVFRSQDEDLIDVAMEQTGASNGPIGGETGGKMWKELRKTMDKMGDFTNLTWFNYDLSMKIWWYDLM